MVTSVLWIGLLVLGLGTNVLLLTSGAVDVLDDPLNGGMAKETQILIRMFFSVVLIGLNGLVLYGGNELRTLGSASTARTACIIACIPCFGPCYLLGIPFGLWGLSKLNDPAVLERFETH